MEERLGRWAGKFAPGVGIEKGKGGQPLQDWGFPQGIKVIEL
jgi:hypothetical protein